MLHWLRLLQQLSLSSGIVSVIVHSTFAILSAVAVTVAIVSSAVVIFCLQDRINCNCAFNACSSVSRCYNCGDFGSHIAAKCPHGPLPKRCHFCKGEDHLIADCPTRKTDARDTDTENGENGSSPGGDSGASPPGGHGGKSKEGSSDRENGQS